MSPTNPHSGGSSPAALPAGAPSASSQVGASAGPSLPLRVLDLFSGIGGFSLGLERTGGFKTVAFCEIEEFPRRVLKKHWPEVPQYHDVRELTADTLARDGIAVDVICGGFPCQDISLVGKQAGIEGERSGLWREVVRLVRDIRPAFIVLENVAALLDRGLGTVLGELATFGYDAEWHCIPAAYVGAPHSRDRIWIIAHRNEGQERARRLIWMPDCTAPDRQGLVFPFGGRVDHGVPDRLDRIGACGNAVVPQIPELIGNAILQHMEASR